MGVEAVIASEFGPSVSVILEQRGIKRYRCRSGLKVEKVLREFLARSNL